MANPISIPLYEELISDFDEQAQRSPYDDSVTSARNKGIESFKRSGFPNRRNEEWKYTNVTPFLLENYTLHKNAKTYVDEVLIKGASIPNLDCYQLILVNGQLQHNSDVSQLPSFITLKTIEEAQNNERFTSFFSKSTGIDQMPFAALNTALFSNGLFIEIAPNAILEKPLHIVHVFTGENNLFVQPRHLLVVSRSASINVIESVVSENSSTKIFVNSFTEVFVEENANCDHYVLQTAQQGVRLVTQTQVSQKNIVFTPIILFHFRVLN